MKTTSLALLSGGLDSTAALILAQESSNIELVLTFDYGQKSAEQEIRSAQAICQKLKMAHRVLKIDFLKVDQHPLFSNQTQSPNVQKQDLDNPAITQKSAKAVWVPNRNGTFINIAASLAEAQNIDQVVVGFNIEEAQTFPDNSIAYIESLNQALSYSTKNSVQVISPTVSLNKSQIVKILTDKQFDFSLLWSCYAKGQTMCGECESCNRLKRALSQNQQENWCKKLFLVP